jgi:hypothetical protein
MKTDTGKQPYAIALADRRLMALAGLWENWRSPAGEWDSQLRDHDDDTQRAVRRDPQSEASDPETGDLAGMAWRRARRRRPAEGHARAIPVRGDDVLAGEPAGRKR